MKTRPSSAILILLVCLAAQIAAAATLPYQGLATNAKGGALPDSSYPATFALYADSQGTRPLWTESRKVSTRKGLFSANLGDAIPVPDSIFDGRNLFLGVSIGGKPESVPRLRLGSVPWAIGAGRSDSSRASRRSDWAASSRIADTAKIVVGLADSLLNLRRSLDSQSSSIVAQRSSLDSLRLRISDGSSRPLDSARISHLSDSSQRSGIAAFSKSSQRADSALLLVGLADSLDDIRHTQGDHSTAIAALKTNQDLMSMILVNGILRSDSSRASRFSDSSKASRYADSAKSSFTAQRSKFADSAFAARVADSSTFARIADSTRRSAFSEIARIAGFSDSARKARHSDSSLQAVFSDSSRAAGFASRSESSGAADSSARSGLADSSNFSRLADTARHADLSDSAIVAWSSDSARKANLADTSMHSIFADSSRSARFSDTSRFAYQADSARFAGVADTTRWAWRADTSMFSRMADSARTVIGYPDSLRNLRSTIAAQSELIARQKTVLEALGELVNRTVLAGTNQMLDVRDGKTYPTVTIGGQTWMAKNLDFKTDSSWCFGNDEANCAIYGRLYSWSAMMGLSDACDSTSCGSQVPEKPRGVCPANWHVPADSEWAVLLAPLGEGPGRILKTTARWANTSGIDSVGFKALPGGFRPAPGQFYNLTTNAGFWTATEQDLGYVWCYHLNYYDDLMPGLAFSKKAGLSVRCVKD